MEQKQKLKLTLQERAYISILQSQFSTNHTFHLLLTVSFLGLDIVLSRSIGVIWIGLKSQLGNPFVLLFPVIWLPVWFFYSLYNNHRKEKVLLDYLAEKREQKLIDEINGEKND